MQQAIVFDLDDTLINTHKRHYLVFLNFLKQHDANTISMEEYLSVRKQNKWSNKVLLDKLMPGYTDKFEKYFLKVIESAEYLREDSPIVSTELLGAIKEIGVKTTVLSLRSNQQTAIEQAKAMPFYYLIDDFIFVKHSAGKNAKTVYLNQLKANNTVFGFISDSSYDKQAAAEAGVVFFAVSTGLYPIDCNTVYADVNEVLLKLQNQQSVPLI